MISLRLATGELTGALAAAGAATRSLDRARLHRHVRLYPTPYLEEVLLAGLSAAQVQATFAAIIRHYHAAGSRARRRR